MDVVSFHVHEVAFPVSTEESLFQKFKNWLLAVSNSESAAIDSLSYIFVSDAYLLALNKKHLDHDTYTDILTFDLSEEGSNTIEGEIYISIERIQENATHFDVDFLFELQRVLVHGLLHLIGYNDHSEEEKAEMRSKEDQYLDLSMLSGAD